MNDTASGMEARYLKMMLCRTAEQRLAMATRMFGTAKTLIHEALRRQHGELSPTDLRCLTFERLYGRDLPAATVKAIQRHLAEKGGANPREGGLQ